MHDLRSRRAWFLDRDGTLTLDDRKLPGADAFLDAVRATGATATVVTNNSSKSPDRHLANLRAAGLDLAPDEVLVSIQAALAHLAARGIRRLHLVANAEVTAWTAAQGFDVGSADPQAALLAYDTEMTYAKMLALIARLRAGLPYFATHIDMLCPTRAGPVPDIGTMLSAIELATGRRPERTFGKPSADMVRPVLEARGLTMADAVIVGDRLYTDIALAQGTDMLSVLVLTGETTRAMHDASPVKASFVADDLRDLAAWIGGRS